MNPFAQHAPAKVAGLLAFALAMGGCDKAPEPVAEPEQQEVILHVRTVDKTGAPVEMVRFYINGKKFGITDQDGAFKGRYPAKDGELLTFNVEAPPGYSVPANIDQSRWRHQVKYPGGRALQLNFTAPLQRPEGAPREFLITSVENGDAYRVAVRVAEDVWQLYVTAPRADPAMTRVDLLKEMGLPDSQARIAGAYAGRAFVAAGGYNLLLADDSEGRLTAFWHRDRPVCPPDMPGCEPGERTTDFKAPFPVPCERVLAVDVIDHTTDNASALLAWLMVNVLKEPGNMTVESRAFADSALMPGVHVLLGTLGGMVVLYGLTSQETRFLLTLAPVIAWEAALLGDRLLRRTSWPASARAAALFMPVAVRGFRFVISVVNTSRAICTWP